MTFLDRWRYTTAYVGFLIYLTYVIAVFDVAGAFR